MPIVSNEIIADITDHIRRFGGDFHFWWVGRTNDAHSPVLETHGNEEKDDRLIYREAYTPDGARTVRDYFVSQSGATCGNGEGAPDGPDDKLVFVYRKPPPEQH